MYETACGRRFDTVREVIEYLNVKGLLEDGGFAAHEVSDGIEALISAISLRPVSSPTVDTKLGTVVCQSDNYVVRTLENPGGMHVYCHRKINGKERMPNGYMLGHSALIMKREKP